MGSEFQQFALVAALGYLQVHIVGGDVGGEGHEQGGGETAHTFADFQDGGPERVLAGGLHPVADFEGVRLHHRPVNYPQEADIEAVVIRVLFHSKNVHVSQRRVHHHRFADEVFQRADFAFHLASLLELQLTSIVHHLLTKLPDHLLAVALDNLDGLPDVVLILFR